jgi:hypothetical protein
MEWQVFLVQACLSGFTNYLKVLSSNLCVADSLKRTATGD